MSQSKSASPADNRAQAAREFLASSARSAHVREQRRWLAMLIALFATLGCGLFFTAQAWPALSKLEHSRDLAVTIVLFAAAIFGLCMVILMVFKRYLRARRYINDILTRLADHDAIEMEDVIREISERRPTGVLEVTARCADGRERPFRLPITSEEVPPSFFDEGGMPLRVEGSLRPLDENSSK